MPKREQQALSQLGERVAWPESPDEAMLERVPNPHPDKVYLARFTAPEFTSLCPVTGAARLRASGHRLRAAALAGREQVAQAVSRLVSQSRRVPRGLHAGNRRSPGRVPASRAGCASAATGIRAAACRSTCSGRPAVRRPTCGFPTRASRPTEGGADAACRCYSRRAFQSIGAAPISDATGVAADSFYGGSRRFLRDDQPRIPPGPEGSNGNGDIGRRRGAGAGRLRMW